jgi:hypothetical protein
VRYISHREFASLEQAANDAVTKRADDGTALEGRYIVWDPETVAQLARVYRIALDHLDAGHEDTPCGLHREITRALRGLPE